MTEKYTLEEAKDALRRIYSDDIAAPAQERLLMEFEAELTTPKFAPGQIIAHMIFGVDCPEYEYVLFNKDAHQSPPDRPLNQTEVGPDWVPRAEFDKLREDIRYFYSMWSRQMMASDEAFEGIFEALDAIPEELK